MTTVVSVARILTMDEISGPGLLTESSCLGRAGIDAEAGTGMRGERLCAFRTRNCCGRCVIDAALRDHSEWKMT